MNEITQIKRENNYDFLRVLATVAVICIHVNWFFFGTSFHDYAQNPVWITESLLNIVTRFSVPAFVMISGAFNLRKEQNENIKKFYQKTSYKIVLPFLVVLAIETTAGIIFNILSHRSMLYGLTGLLTNGVFNLWYIYMLMGLYLLTPLLVKMKSVLSWKEYKLFAVTMMIWAVISQTTSVQRMAYSIGLVFAYLGYYLLGDVIRTEIEKREFSIKMRCVIDAVIIAAVSIIVTYYARIKGLDYYVLNWNTNFFSPTITIYSICIFVIFSSLSIDMDLYWISKRTFYIYLFHTIVLNVLVRLISSLFQREIVAIVLLTVLTFVFSFIIALLFEMVWNGLCKKASLEKKWNAFKIWQE